MHINKKNNFRLKEKQAKRKVTRAEEEKKLAERKKQEEERRQREIEEKKQRGTIINYYTKYCYHIRVHNITLYDTHININ